jgi:hypothetical protein
MGLADELKTLQELHDSGKLTEPEYADAKASTLNKYKGPVPATGASKPFIRTRTVILLLLLLLLLGVIWKLISGK